MVMANALPQQFKIVQLAWPQTTNGGVTSDFVSLKNAHKVTIVAEFIQAVGHATVVAIRQSDDVSATTTAAGPASARVWVNEDVAASDTLVQGANLASETLTNDVKKKQVVFEVDASELTDGYDCVYVTVSNSSQASNLVSITAFLHTRYPGATPPTAITD